MTPRDLDILQLGKCSVMKTNCLLMILVNMVTTLYIPELLKLGLLNSALFTVCFVYYSHLATKIRKKYAI